MENIIRTVQGAKLQTSQLLGTPLVIDPHSTLNEKFNIHADLLLTANDKPTIKYIAIGNGGHAMAVGSNNITYPKPIQHTPRHAALYNQLPFVLRLPNNDLTAAEVTKYRLRKNLVVNGVTYIAYYLKLLDLTATHPQLELRSVTNGVTTATGYTPTVGDLNPTPPVLPSTGVVSTTGDYIAATAKVPFIMSPSDISEFLNVCNIIYGDVNYGIVSELALCSGVDRSVTGIFRGTSLGYNDAIAVQVVSFINTIFAANFANAGWSISLDVGSLESLLTLQ